MSQPKRPEGLRLALLGPPQLEQDGEPVHISTRKAMALFAYLAITKQAHSREALATLFWPELDQSRALANLRRTLWILNDRLGEEWLEVDAETAALHPEPSIWVDVDAFRRLLAESQAHDQGEADVCATCLPTLSEAVALYEDDFMAGFTLPDCPAFDEWQFFERDGLRAELAGTLQKLVGWYTSQGQWETAIRYARRWLALDPLQEPAHRALMRLYAWDGQRAAALRQYDECARILDEELAVPPEQETTQLHEAIRAKQLSLPGSVAPGAAVPAGPAHQPVPRHNLPPQPTPFVGREAELAETARLLQEPDCRLLTLVGPGGVGKSRLALEAAAAQLDHSPNRYLDGVYWVALGPVTATDAVVPTIAAALDFSFYPREGETPKQQLLNYLCEKQMLLLLDNFEQLMDGADLITEILDCAPGLRLLVTSRERLNLQPEWVYQVRGLRYPREESVESLEEYDAVQLFLRRARQVDAGFAPSGNQIPGLIRICQLVDGMPLGLELAASWVNMMSCGEIAGEIEQNLDFLTTSLRDVPERHRNLRAVCDQSWALLTQTEQRAFAALSVFRGGFRREAAERVAGASLSILSALVDKSLVRPGPSGRYDVHPLLQQYAAEQLGADPRAKAEARDRHSAYFLAYLQHREAALKGAGQIQALEEICADLANVRAPWRWATAHGLVAEMARTAPSLWLFYEMRTLFEEGERAFAEVVAALEPRAGQGLETDLALGLALAFQGRFAGRLYRFEESKQLLQRGQELLRRLGARRELALANSLFFYSGAWEIFPDLEQLLHESLAIYRSLGDRWGVAFALSRFLWGTRQDEGARQYLQESLAIGREVGDRLIVSFCLFQLGQASQGLGAYREAKERYGESLTVFRELGDRQMEQTSLDHIGYVARALEEYEEARQCHEESLAISRETGDRLGTAGSLHNLGLVARDLGDYGQAEQYFGEALAIRREVGQTWALAFSLASLGEVALARGDYREARRWYQESLDVTRGGEGQAQAPEALWGLGQVSSAEGDVEQARQHFREALELETAGQGAYVPLVLEIVLDLARLAVRTGEKEKAADWLTYVADNAGSEPGTRNKASRLLGELASELPPEAIAAARERSSGKALGEIVQEVSQGQWAPAEGELPR